ncbi:MAG: hypothetical protein M3R21_00305 [Candidatus Dormibacteraeota bacterium]|nr:hypothetical protein [Candidatus Dormibacteraeota bacterium]
MIIKWLHRLGVPSDAAYVAALGSIATSIGAWAWRNEKDVANAERLGIFIGLWAPTFMLIGNALKDEEIAARSEGEEMSGVGRRLQNAVEPRARKVEAAVDELMDRGAAQARKA